MSDTNPESSAAETSEAKPTADYQPPVDRLLDLAPPDLPEEEWLDYVGEFGLGAEHVPELIRMATDPALHWAPDNKIEVGAPIHAWRALAQLRASEAVEPLVSLLGEITDRELLQEELPFVFAGIGSPAIPVLERALHDRGNHYWNRLSMAEGLRRIAEAEPETRDAAVSTLTEVLAGFPEEEEREFNSFLLSELLKLRAVEAAPVIQRAYEAGAIIEGLMGDWEDAQVELGLLEERLTPKPRRESALAVAGLAPPERGSPEKPTRPRNEKKVQKNRARKKLAKESRKQNRKRR